MSIALKNDAGTFSTNLNQSNPTANVNITLPTDSGTMALTENKLVLGTAYTFTGTEKFKDFTGIPSWAKRITVMLSGVSTSGTSGILIQLGDSGGIENTGYTSTSTYFASETTNTTSSVTGILIDSIHATSVIAGAVQIINVSANNFVTTGTVQKSTTTSNIVQGSKTLSGTLDRIRITTVNGTDTFDAGTINVMWE